MNFQQMLADRGICVHYDVGELEQDVKYLRDRYGLLFAEAIGVRIAPDGSTLPLFYGEVKIDADNQYHPVPRTRSSQE